MNQRVNPDDLGGLGAAITPQATWRRLTRQANAAFQAGDAGAAQRGYDAALSEAARLFDLLAASGANPVPVAAIWVISCHNLAEAALRDGQPDRAEAHYRAAFDRLLQVARDVSAPLGLRMDCAANLKQATIALVGFLQANGTPVLAIAETITRARIAVARVSRRAARLADQPAPQRPS